MERKSVESQSDNAFQFGKVDKSRSQRRFQRSLVAGPRNNFDGSRKTPRRRIEIQQTQGLKYPKPQEAIGRATAFFSGPEPNFSIPEPVEDSGGLDPDDKIMLNVDPQILQLLVEDQRLVQPSYHHIETVRFPNNPFSPDSDEDRYDEESGPNLFSNLLE